MQFQTKTVHAFHTRRVFSYRHDDSVIGITARGSWLITDHHRRALYHDCAVAVVHYLRTLFFFNTHVFFCSRLLFLFCFRYL